MTARAAALLLAVCLAVSQPGAAQTTPDLARGAASELARAAGALRDADGARGRIAALTAVVAGYEDGLAAVRDGLRRVEGRIATLRADLDAREAEIARLLAALQVIDRTPDPLLLLHPTGPLGAARATMMLSEAVPALDGAAAALRRDLVALRDLRALESRAADSLRTGLSEIETARAALSEAIARRGDLPDPVAQDAPLISALRGRVDTLVALADGLADLSLGAAFDPATDLPLALPVAGRLLRGFDETPGSGGAHPGLSVAVAPGTTLSAPVGGTLRYVGPLPDYGNVIVLEPVAEMLLVFAGLSDVYVRTGGIVQARDPLGLLGDGAPDRVESLRNSVADAGASRPETLYIEVRQGGRPVDPAKVFATE